MVRVKKGVHALKRRRKLLHATKGYRHGRKSKERAARQAWFKASEHSFAHRRRKKSEFRGLWQNKIGAATRAVGIPYNTFIANLKKHRISLNRKVLADLAENNTETFSRIIEKVQ